MAAGYAARRRSETSLRARYEVIPDMRWVDMRHFISADGTCAASEWTVRGTPRVGAPIDWLGCDLWEFRDGEVVRKGHLLEIHRGVNDGGRTGRAADRRDERAGVSRAGLRAPPRRAWPASG